MRSAGKGRTKRCEVDAMKSEDESVTDEKVASAYRKFSAEKAPAELDRAVLRAARAGARHSMWARFYTWRRPLAFVTTLVLGVALVHDMQTLLRETDDSILPRTSIDDTVSRPSGTGTGIPSVEHGDKNVATPALPPGNGVAAEADDANLQKAQERRVDEFSKTAQPGAEHNRTENTGEREDARGTGNRQIISPSSPSDTAAQKATSAPLREEAKSMLVDAGNCREEQVETAEIWWRCIEELRAAGQTHAADAELQKLKSRFPDFEGTE